jgi:hypothetical protein
MDMAIVDLQETPLIADLDDENGSVEGPLFDPGTRVEVRRRFDAKWARGFEVLEHTDGRYRLRRLSDGAALPVLFPEGDIRAEKRNNSWWF